MKEDILLEGYYTLTVRELDWVVSALGNNVYHPELRFASLCLDRNGHLLIGATDAHRLHIIDLGPPASDCPLAPASPKPYKGSSNRYRLIDARRVLAEAEYADSTVVAISHDLAKVCHQEYLVGELTPVYAPVLPAPGSQEHVNFVRVIPENPKPITELFAIDQGYLRDATKLAHQTGYRVVLRSESPNGPILIESPGAAWRAIVMPMSLDENMKAYFEPAQEVQP